MGISKSSHFNEQQNSLANIAKALGHPARLAIVEFLLQQKECVCGDIVSELPLAQATVSQHLKELKTAGIIKGNIEGNSICYCLNEETIAEFISFLSNITTTISNQRNQCC
jgi:DNA-binding transcriptional ArsR family regulator